MVMARLPRGDLVQNLAQGMVLMAGVFDTMRSEASERAQVNAADEGEWRGAASMYIGGFARRARLEFPRRQSGS